MILVEYDLLPRERHRRAAALFGLLRLLCCPGRVNGRLLLRGGGLRRPVVAKRDLAVRGGASTVDGDVLFGASRLLPLC